MWLFTLVIPPLNNEIVRNFLNIVITYLLSSEVLRRMINSNDSSLTMELNEMNKEVLDPMDMIKMYWSFYWRETLIELVFIIIFFLLFRGIRFISLLPAIITLLILTLVLLYYVGRYVFKHVISSVWWSIGRIEISLSSSHSIIFLSIIFTHLFSKILYNNSGLSILI
jgi:hypothetical protein